jgi:hypothetical protein
MSVEQTLSDRGTHYGDYAARARIEQAIIETMECSGGWHRLNPAHKSAARMIAVKLSRILNGDPDHLDSWHDIAGYAQLVETEIGR